MKSFCIETISAILVFSFFAILPAPCPGQEKESIDIPSSFNPVGSGARALGMGGAFIAVADDATAASWNPAGLIQLEHPEISLVYEAFHRMEDIAFGTNPESSGMQTVSKSAVNYASAAYRFSCRGRNMIFSLNYQRLYDFTRQWDFHLPTDGETLAGTDAYHYTQDGGLSALGLAYAAEITPRLSLGMTLNVWNDDITPNHWERKLIQKGSGQDAGDDFKSQALTIDEYALKGVNANFGVLWNPVPRLTVGAVLKTPFEAELEHRYLFQPYIRFSEFPEAGQNPTQKEPRETDETLDMPLSFGIGAAWQVTRDFTVSMDFYRTEWDDFILTESDGSEVSPITGKPADAADIAPTHQVRIGAEYLLITSRFIIPLCAGVFYDPAPAPGHPDDIFGFSAGSGIGWGRYHLDLAYQFRFGNGLAEYMIEERRFSQNLREHTIYTSLVVHF